MAAVPKKRKKMTNWFIFFPWKVTTLFVDGSSVVRRSACGAAGSCLFLLISYGRRKCVAIVLDNLIPLAVDGCWCVICFFLLLFLVCVCLIAFCLVFFVVVFVCVFDCFLFGFFVFVVFFCFVSGAGLFVFNVCLSINCRTSMTSTTTTTTTTTTTLWFPNVKSALYQNNKSQAISDQNQVLEVCFFQLTSSDSRLRTAASECLAHLVWSGIHFREKKFDPSLLHHDHKPADQLKCCQFPTPKSNNQRQKDKKTKRKKKRKNNRFFVCLCVFFPSSDNKTNRK